MPDSFPHAPVFDLHCDAVLKLVHRACYFDQDNPLSHVDIPKMKRGDVDGLIYSLWSDPVFKGEDAVNRTQFMLDVAKKEIERCAEEVSLCKTNSDLENSKKNGKISALLGIEGGASIHNSLQHLENFAKQGVRRMTLTHTGSNDWAGSATDDGKNRGLSDFGKDVVLAMNSLGMIVDVAHACEKTFLDAVKVSKKPVFCTHSLSKSVFPSERLASDEMIQAIGESGGVFGVALFPAFFTNQNPAATKTWMENIIAKMNAGGSASGTLEEQAHANAALFMDSPPPSEIADLTGLLPHLDHVIHLIGDDHVGIGSDFDGMPFGPRGLEDCSRFDILRALLKNHGYSEERIFKIMGGNVRRVLPKVLL